MQRRPDKRKTAPAGSRGGLDIDRPDRQIDNQEYNPVGLLLQGLYSHAPAPYPVAVARQFGFFYAVYVRNQSGQVERRGLFESAKIASLAARELNRLFEQERTVR